jgi:hypothetical protein
LGDYPLGKEMQKSLEIILSATESTHPIKLCETIPLLELNPTINLIHEIMSWEILETRCVIHIDLLTKLISTIDIV